MTPPRHVRPQLRTPENLVSRIDDFVDETPGVSHALIVSADGLALVASQDFPKDLADPLSAMVAGLVGLCKNIAGHINRGTCEHVMLRLTHGHLLFMRMGSCAGLAVLTETSANLGMVAYQMNRIVDRTGHLLTPNPREDLRRHGDQKPS